MAGCFGAEQLGEVGGTGSHAEEESNELVATALQKPQADQVVEEASRRSLCGLGGKLALDTA